MSITASTNERTSEARFAFAFVFHAARNTMMMTKLQNALRRSPPPLICAPQIPLANLPFHFSERENLGSLFLDRDSLQRRRRRRSQSPLLQVN